MAAERGLVHSNVAEMLLVKPDDNDRLKLKKIVFEALPLAGPVERVEWLDALHDLATRITSIERLHDNGQ